MTLVALAFVSPVLVTVYRHLGQTVTLGPLWLLAIAAMIVAHFLCVWALFRLVLRTRNRFDVATSQLAANATSHVAPAGSAVGAGIQLRMLTVAGFPVSRAATSLAAVAVLGTVASYVVLPLGVLAASATGGHVAHRLVTAMWSATATLTALLVVAVLLALSNEPWRWAARAVAAGRRLFGRPIDPELLSTRLIQERDMIRATLRRRIGLVVFFGAGPAADRLRRPPPLAACRRGARQRGRRRWPPSSSPTSPASSP